MEKSPNSLYTSNFAHVIGIRTHQWTSLENKLYTRLQQYFHPDNIFVIADETTNIVNTPTEIKKISLNIDLLNKLNILSSHPHPRGLGWLCGDYFYYAFANTINAQYYWLIEPDVDFTFQNISIFFKRYEYLTHDALLHNFEQAPESWHWTHKAKIIDQNPYQAFFPLSRLSRQAIDTCLAERQRISKIFQKKQLDLFLYPNDESLVATAMVKHCHSVSNLAHIKGSRNSFRHFTYAKPIVMPHGKNSLPRNQVIHPSRSPNQFANSLVAQIMKQENSLNKLADLATYQSRDVPEIIQHAQEIFSLQLSNILMGSLRLRLVIDLLQKFIKQKSLQSKNCKMRLKQPDDRRVMLTATIHLNTGSNRIIDTHILEWAIQDANLSCDLSTHKDNNNFLSLFSDYEENPHADESNRICLLLIAIHDEHFEQKIWQCLNLFENNLDHCYNL